MRSRILVFILMTGAVASADTAPFVYNDHGKPDPFWPLVNSSGALMHYDDDLSSADLLLEGIVTGQEGKNFAIVNGKVVKANDKIGSYIIEKIENDKVILIKGEERVILNLKKEEDVYE